MLAAGTGVRIHERAGDMIEKVVSSIGALWSHLKEAGVVPAPKGTVLSLELLRMELAEIGLLGRAFGPEEYRAALEMLRGSRIAIEEVPDGRGGSFEGEFARDGLMAEAVVDPETGDAVILVRESLRYQPWPGYELSLFHELSHLAADHPVRSRRTPSRRTARFWSRRAVGASEEELREKVLEVEARIRAKWLVVAGTSPRAFEAEKANRLI